MSATTDFMFLFYQNFTRFMSLVLQQYEEAIKLYRAGKPVDFDELPTPPGQ